MGERGKERKMLEKRGHYDSEVEANERKMVLEERIRAHVKFLSSGEYVLCFVNPQSLSRAGDCDPGMYTLVLWDSLHSIQILPILANLLSSSNGGCRVLFSVLELSTNSCPINSKANM